MMMTMSEASGTRSVPEPVPEITPLDRYDFSRAKSRASLTWICNRAFSSADGVPAEVSECVGVAGCEVGVALERLLLSSELYCGVYCSLLHSCSSSPPADHAGLLHLLQQRGLRPLHTHTHTPVTHTQLAACPANMGAHLAVIDSLMSLAAMETVGAVKMAKEAEQFGGGTSWENSLLFWINKINQKLRESSEAEDGQKPQPCTDLQPVQPSCPTRWYWKLVPIRYRKDKVRSKQTPTFSVVSGVKDLSNGGAIAAAIHFYCPQLLPLEDVCLKDTMSVADSLYNLQMIKDFCDENLKGCCPLVLEDLLYSPPTLRMNIMCFLSELLAEFEVTKPDFVKPIHTLDLTDASGLEDCTSPINGSSGSPSFLFKQPMLPVTSPGSPGAGTDGRGWSKKQISRPLSAVAFSIPFPLDSDVDVVMGNPLFRSVSTDSLTNPVPYTPPEDLSKLIGQAPMGELPAIEEALQVIHVGRSVRNEPRQRPEGAPAGFYLHSPDNDRLSSSAPCRSAMMYRPIGAGSNNGRRTGAGGRAVDCSRDDDSVLRDGSIDSDASEEFSKSSNPATPANGPKAGRMTSFAERRKKLPESPGTPGAQGTEELLSPAMMSPAGAVEAQELGARLEEKRRAIEAQKRRIEAIFTKHRQRLGKSAFLQLQREQGEGVPAGGAGAGEEADSLSLDERLTRMEAELQQEEEREKEEKKENNKAEEKGKPGREVQGNTKAAPKLEKQVTFSVEAKKVVENEPPLVEYNEAVSKLSCALQSLQKDMQRLTEQQQKLMGKKTSSPVKTTSTKKTQPPSKAWVIPANSKNTTTTPRLSRESTRELSPLGSPSRRGDPKSPKSSSVSTPASTSTTPRKPANSTPKSPKRQHPTRPSDLSFPPLTRILVPTQTVDTLPHLRRVSPSQCQVQTNSSLWLGGPQTPQQPSPPAQESASASSESGSSNEHTPLFTLELEAGPPPPPAAAACPVSASVGGGSSSGPPSECSFESDVLLSAPLRQEDTETDPEQLDIFSSDSMSDQTETESRAGIGFYFKEDGLSEEEMALKRALLLERQQRRAEELKKRRQEQNSRQCSMDDLRPSVTPPLSQSLPSTHTPPPALQATPPDTPQRRGGFTRAEYERRQQLRIMEELEKAMKPKPGQRSRKTHTHGTHTRSPRKERAAAQSSSSQPNGPMAVNEKAVKVGDSPSRLASPARPSYQNAEKECENSSNVSSPASVQEYSGPKLFKEPSFKSNKFIIHNALSSCCLAGKVNESQKNKIVEEMEKSSANHFLILLRDANCQFRAIYTLDSQSDELQRLCGVGPRVIPCSAMEAIYKYSSDRKQFSVLPSRTVSMSVDAFTVPAHLWHTKKQGTPKKTANPK